MVLESILGEKNIRKHPVFILLVTMAISFGSIFFATQVFSAYASVLSVAFITIGLVPIIHGILLKEEYDEVVARKNCTTFFARHFNLIMIYVWVFVGIILSFSIVYMVTPPEVKTIVFAEQIKQFCVITGECSSGLPFSITGRATSLAYDVCASPVTKDPFSCSLFIFQNNFQVLILTIALSIFYGAGAIFIIAWNASLLGLFFGEMILTIQYTKVIGFTISMIIAHGVPELFGYIFGALAGGILSVMIAKGQLLKHECSTILKDVLFLAGLGVFSIIYGSIVEGLGIVGLGDISVILGFIYLLSVVVLVYLYGSKKQGTCAIE